jgi:hypothetical protein
MAAPFHRRVSKEQLCTLVPSGLRHLAEGVDLPEPYVVVVFSDRLVRLGHVKRALKKLGSLHEERLIVAGIDFTQEALAFAASRGAHVLEQQHFGWTEARFDEIHTKISTGKKRPLR